MKNLTDFLDLFRKDMWNSFNALIVVLTIIDTLLCIFLMTDYTFARAFELHTVIYTMLYPYFIYPMVNIMLSASIYLTVVLGIERWVYFLNNVIIKQTNNWISFCVKYCRCILSLSCPYNTFRPSVDAKHKTWHL